MAPKLVGLVVAMGFFGLGPGTVLVEEISTTLKRKRKHQREEDEAAVAPPGEESHRHGHQTDDRQTPTGWGAAPAPTANIPRRFTEVNVPRRFTETLSHPPGIDLPHYPQQHQPYGSTTPINATGVPSLSSNHESSTANENADKSESVADLPPPTKTESEESKPWLSFLLPPMPRA